MYIDVLFECYMKLGGIEDEVFYNVIFGTTEWIRTTDPYHVKVVL